MRVSGLGQYRAGAVDNGDSAEMQALGCAATAEFDQGYERSNRPTAENRAEETLCAFVVAKLSAEPLKTEQTMVLYARV